MNNLTLIGGAIMHRYQDWSTKRARPVHTPTPMGLHQGSSIRIDPLPLLLARGNATLQDSILPEVEGGQSVVAVGCYHLFGRDMYRSYLSDGRSYIQTVTDNVDPTKVIECRLYVCLLEDPTMSTDDEDVFVGADEHYHWDNTGPVPVKVVTRQAVPAYIGCPVFDVAKNPAQRDVDNVRFVRAWMPGTQDEQPKDVYETLHDASGAVHTVRNRMMAYARPLPSGAEEHLLANYITTTQDGLETSVFQAAIGIDLDATTLLVFAS